MNIPTAKAVSSTMMARERSKLTGALLPYWNYGKDYVNPSSDAHSVIQTFRGWVAIYAAANARAVASVPLRMYVAKRTSTSKMLRPTKSISRRKDTYLRNKSGLTHVTTKAVEIEEVLEHPFLDLMTRMNGFANYYDQIMLANMSLEIAGNEYWYLPSDSNGIPFEIWRVPVQYMSIVPDEQDFIKGYLFTNGTKKIAYDESEIVHFKDANLWNPYYGIGKVVPISDTYNIMRNMDTYENAIFTNMGRPDGILKTDQHIPIEEDRKRIIREWNEVYGGAVKAGKTALTTNGVEYQVVSSTPREMAYIEGRPLNEKEIAQAFGHTEAMSKASSMASATVGSVIYMRDTIQPQLKLLEDKYNEKIIPRYNDQTIFCAYDDPVPGNEEEMRKNIQVFVGSGVISRNEAREELGMDQGDAELDTIYIASGLVPIGTEPTPPTPAPAQEPAPDQNDIDNDDEKSYINSVAQSIMDKVKDYGY
jgi:HK97 family phage portal protein